MRVLALAGAIAAAAATGAAIGSIGGCQQASVNPTTRSLQLPQKLDVVCMLVNDANGNPLKAPTPVAQTVCQQVPVTNTNPAALPYHLYAAVTQTGRGALGIVDLTAGLVVDVDKSTPGFDFIPVGANPTDVAASVDGSYTFVASADPNKFAIYGVDNTRLLGNSTGTNPPPPLTFPELSACALPQPPEALSIVPSGEEASGPAGSFVLVVTLRENAGAPAAVVTVSFTPQPITGTLAPCTILGATALSAAIPPPQPVGPTWPDGVPYADAGDLPLPVPPVAPTCSADDAGGPPPVDAGVLPPPQPHPVAVALRSDTPTLYVADGNMPVIHVIDLSDPANPREESPLVATDIVEPTRRVSVGPIAISPATHDYKTYLYAVDTMKGSLMVYDVTDPVESSHVPLVRPHSVLTPLMVPDRIVLSAPVAAVAFASHDWPLQLPADATHPYGNLLTGLLCNPNPNAHPNATDFLAPGAYYRGDTALVQMIESMDTQGGTIETLPQRLRGVFGFATLTNGNVVAIDVDDWDAPCRRPDPMSAGPILDPTAPPDAGPYAGGLTGALDLPEPPPTGSTDYSEYHAPITYQNYTLNESSAVTDEVFFPVSAPHRVRSSSLLRNDPTTGERLPFLVGAPVLLNASGAAVGSSGAAGTGPIILPTPLPASYIDPSYQVSPADPSPAIRVEASVVGVAGPDDLAADVPGSDIRPPNPDRVVTGPPGVRLSFDDATAAVDQDWTVTYEGPLPGAGSVSAELVPGPNYQSLTLSAPGAHLCSAGIEDWSIGQARASQVLAAVDQAFMPPPRLRRQVASRSVVQDVGLETSLPQWTADYAEIADDLLVSTDKYWTLPKSDENDCWDPSLAGDEVGNTGAVAPVVASNRYNFCLNTFGTAATADTELLRDLPIIEAYDDRLTVTRFAWSPTDSTGNPLAEQTTNRIINPPDPSNGPWLSAVRCCFHHQATFKVRTGGEWVALGSVVGLLNHVTTGPGGRCTLSCDPHLALMNARSFDVPWAASTNDGQTCTPLGLPSAEYDLRNSPMAMRNPMLSYVMWSGCGPHPATDHTLSVRDFSWRFSTRGSLTPLTMSIVTQGGTSAVSPQSMRFIGPLGQMAVVDGLDQGLVLIDLNVVAVVRSYF